METNQIDKKIREDFLPKSGKYYFEKTEISEIAPRPSVVTLDLLNLIYSDDGPVAKVYKKYGVRYTDTGFIKIIGNELFVDKEKEIQGLLPSFSYLLGDSFAPKLVSFSKTLPTLKNFFFLSKIRTKRYKNIFEALKSRIETDEKDILDTKTALENLLTDYELVFETNLLSGLSIKKLGLMLKNDSVAFPQIEDGSSIFLDLAEYQVTQPKGLIGNSLDLADESGFSGGKGASNKPNKEVSEWWGSVPEYRKKVLQAAIREAIVYNRLRELGRWLTLKRVSALRSALLKNAKELKFKHPRDIFFAHLADIMSGKAKEASCIKAKSEYLKYNHINLPNTITSAPLANTLKLIGVSAGQASGVLQNLEAIISNKEKSILYTELLAPDLTKYFDKLSGIVSHSGGALSHLAIMARESKIPVVVGFSMENSDIGLGDKVQIDGSSGKIEKIN